MKNNLVVIIFSVVVVVIASMCSFTSSQVSQKETEAAQMRSTLADMEEVLTLQVAELTENVIAPVPPATQEIIPSATAELVTGAISGKLSYPSDFIPELTIIAFEVVDNTMTGTWYSVDTEMNQRTYQIEGLPAGFYYVIAYMRDAGANALRAGYTLYVPCGLSVSCEDHSLIAVEVKAGMVTEGVDPGDWYVDPSTYPPNPSE